MTLPTLPESRFRFLLPRLVPTLAVIALFYGLVRLAWYPGLSFDLAGVDRYVGIAAVFVILVGPLLTTLIYKHDKKGMWLDVFVLLAVELVALSAAGYVVHERRPVYLVFAIDRFEIIGANEVDRSTISYPELRSGSFPVLVTARMPDSAEARESIFDESIFGGGADIERRPELWHPYESATAQVLGKARSLDILDANDVDGEFAEWKDRLSGPREAAGFLPVRGRIADGSAIIDAAGTPVTFIAVDPWIN